MVAIRPVALIAVMASSAYAQTMTINSLIGVVACQPQLISWTGGTAPYFLSILPGGQPNAAALEDLGTQNGNSLTWKANLPVGTSAFLNLRDSTGLVAQSGTFTEASGSDTSCIGQSPSTTAGATTAPGGDTTTAAGATTTPAGTTSPAGTTGATTTKPTTSSSSTVKPSSAALSLNAPAGALAMLCAAALAVIV